MTNVLDLYVTYTLIVKVKKMIRMKLNEVTKHIEISKRAIKYYEEQGFLHVARDENGYRNYSEDNILQLKEIVLYRKLGISLSDIKRLLQNKDVSLLIKIMEEKRQNLTLYQQEINALEVFIQQHNVERLYKAIDYSTIAQAIQDAIPGFYGYYFMHHFLPYLQIKIETPQQQTAYQNIIQYWDNTEIKLPLSYKITGMMLYFFNKHHSLKTMVVDLDRKIQSYLNPSSETYDQLKKQIQTGVKMKQSFLYKYRISGYAQRAFMRELQNKGYNDIFLPNMILLSPKYKEYQDALQHINKRICDDLGLYYDSNFQLIQKKVIK